MGPVDLAQFKVSDSDSLWERLESIFGWMNTVGGFRKRRYK